MKELQDHPSRLTGLEAVLSSYLEAVDGWTLYDQDSTLYILCQKVKEADLEDMARHILTLILETTSANAGYRILSLPQEQESVLACVLDERNNQSLTLVTARPDSAPKRDPGLMTRVLLVEDDEVTRWMVRRTLKEDCFLATASCVRKAIASFTAFEPELTFLDLNLPDGHGLEVLEYIMAHDPGARVVIFSGEQDHAIHDKALKMGAIGFINKPFLKEKLLSFIKMV